MVGCKTDAECADQNPCTVRERCELETARCVSDTTDADGDGFAALACSGTDCDDTRADVHVGALELCNDLDDDCNGFVDDLPPSSDACGAGQACVAGQCSCLLGTSDCGGECVDLQGADKHCGACGQACTAGFACGQGECVDLDECDLGTARCNALRACENQIGGYVCGDCPSGYRPVGSYACEDVDECALANGGCDSLTQCVNTRGGHRCGPCPGGYQGTGELGCEDRNECLFANGGCDARRACVNFVGGHSCGPCSVGFVADGPSSCRDVDECALANGGCDALTACFNQAGGFRCGACPEGYTGSGAKGCVDVDECATSHGGCSELRSCTNSAGGHSCGPCPSGYVTDGPTGCRDVDECATNRGGCSPLRDCQNRPGSRVCGPCKAGFRDVGETQCADIDECASNNGGCDALTRCVNSTGSFACTSCPSGYSGTGASGCKDINECATNNGGCDPLTSCTNLPGTRACGVCPSGYVRVGTTDCAPTLTALLVSRRARISPELSPSERNYALEFDLNAAVARLGLAVVSGVQIKVDGVSRTSREMFEVDTDGPSDSLQVVLTGSNGKTSQYTIAGSKGCGVVQRTHFKPNDVYAARQFSYPIALDGSSLYVGARWDETDPTHKGAIYSYTRGTDGWTQGPLLRVPERTEYSNFGAAISIDGNWMAVGADSLRGEADANGTQESSVGAVFMYQRDGNGWKFAQKLRASNPSEGDFFGSALSLRGSLLVVGAASEDGAAATVNGPVTDDTWESGAAYVFELTGQQWRQTAYLKSPRNQSNAHFGQALIVSHGLIFVGAPSQRAGNAVVGGLFVYQPNATSWSLAGEIVPTAPEEGWGLSLSVSADDALLMIGAAQPLAGTGAAHLYEWSSNSFQFVRRFVPEAGAVRERYGMSSAFGTDWLAIGAPYATLNQLANGYVDLYRLSGGVYESCGRVRRKMAGPATSLGRHLAGQGNFLFGSDPNETSNATGINGTATVTSGAEAGAVFEFELGAFNLTATP